MTTTKDSRFEIVVGLIADRQIAEHGTAPKVNPDRYRSTVVNRIISAHGDHIADYLNHNAKTPPQLAADRLYLDVEGT